MVKTGGTLSSRMIELVGDLNQTKTLANIKRSIRAMEKSLEQQDTKLKINAELFGKVEDIRKDVTKLQTKINSSPQIKKIKLGVELGTTTKKDINAQIESIQASVDSGGVNKLKLDIDFDFKGSASKIKEEMEGIRQFMARYGEQMKNMDIVNLDKDAENAKRNAGGIKTSIQTMGQGIDKVSNDIEADMRKMTTSSGKFGVTFERDVSGAVKSATGTLTNANGTIERFKYNVDDTSKELVHMSTNTKVAGDQSERYQKLMSEADKAQKDFNKALADAPHDANTRSIAESTQSQQALIEKMRETGTVTDEGSSAIDRMKNATRDLKTHTDNFNLDQKFKEAGEATRKAVIEFERLGGSANDIKRFEDAIDNMANGATGDMNRLQSEVKEATESMLREANRFDSALSNMERQQFQTAIKDRDIETVRRYVEQIEGAEVSSVRFTQRKDSMGRSIDKVAVNMKEVNGAVDSYTYEMNRAEGTIDKVNSSTKELSDSNKGLEGGFGSILRRVTQYMGAMQLVQKSMQALKRTVREIREIDEERIELSRVADPSLNLDVILERSVAMSKDLGANVKDVMQSVAEMARTFGEFNEAQLLAITQTATIATNVSDLDMGEATSAIVASIQAFNIEAEDSIRIINSLNEVDNNYAISTHQLAEGMSRAGATASTFGVEMEELAGDITAVGAVTQESGQRIGTALRTIYSRVTTIDASREILEDMGIAMYEMGASGPEIRDVSDILGDLAGQWNTLSDEQRQNIGVTMAGRSRLTQFLALMNNYEMSINATATAYNSQGSAMREQEKYMQSYEYQYNVLGSAVTDLALTIEDKLVGDALYLLITTGVDLLEMLDSLMDKFGVLPVIVGGATTAFLAFGGESSKALLGGVTSAVETFVLKMAGADGAIGKIGGTALNAMGAMGGFGKFLAGGAVLGAVMLLAKGIEYLIGKMAETRRANDEAERSFQNSMELFNQNGQNIDSMINRYDELNKKLNANKEALTTDEQQEYNTLVNDLSTMMPSAVSHIDAQGQAHLRSADAMRDNANALKEMAESHSAYVEMLQQESVTEHFEDMESVFKRYNDSSENMDKRIDRSKQSFEDFAKEMKEANKGVYDSINNLELSDESLRKIYDEGIRNYADASTKHLSLQYELHGAYQETLLLLGDQTVAYMGSKGQLENVSTTAQALIRDYARINEGRIENIHLIEDEEERLAVYNQALSENKEFGDLVAQAYDYMAEGLNGLDTERAIEEFDSLVGSLPDEALQGSMDEIEGYFNGMQNVVTQIMTNAEVDVDSLVQTLVNAGMDVDTATDYIITLGIEMENQAIRVAVAEEELTSYNDELTHTRDLALETVDPLSALFGLDSESGRAMDSHIQTLQVLRQQYGDTWSEMSQGQESIGALAREFGVSESFIIANLDEMGQAIRALNTATVEWSDESQQYIWSFDESVTESTKNLVMSMMENSDSYGGFVNAYVEQNGIVKHSQEELAGFTEELTERFNTFAEAPNDRDSWNLLVGDLSEQLEHLYGNFMVVEDEAGKLKFQLADGTESDYFNSLNEQLEESDLKLEMATDTADGLLKVFVTGLDGEKLHALAVIDDTAQSGTFAIQDTEEALKGLISTATSEEDKQTFIKTLDNQLDIFGGNLQTTKDEAGNLKLEFEGGGTSPWLDALNTSIEDSGLKVKMVEDNLGNLKLSLVDEKGNVFFSGIDASAETAKEEVKETQKEIDNLYRKAEGNINSPTPIRLDNSSAVSNVQEVGSNIDEVSNKEIDLKIDDSFVTSYNDVVEKIGLSKIEIADVESKLAQLERDLRVTGENLESVMTNISTVSEARHAVRNLIEDIENAKSELGLLYEQFAKGNLDTSALTTASGTISNEAENIKTSFNQIVSSIRTTTAEINNMAPSFNIVPVMRYRTGVELSTSGVMTALSRMANGTNTYMKMISGMYQDNLNKLVTYRLQSEMQVQLVMRTYGKFADHIDMTMTDVERTMSMKFMMAVTRMTNNSKQLNEAMKKNMQSLKSSTVSEITTMSEQMVNRFKIGANSIVGIASGLPRRIGQGVRQNMESATSSMSALANNMVKRFKQALGIHSPSRVFESLGGFVIDGLVNGLTDSSLTGLGQNVFSDFSDGAISTIDQIKGYMTFEPVTSGSFGSEFRRTSGYGQRSSPGGIGSTNHRGVDYGAPAGTPIRSQSSGRVVASGYNGTRGNYVIVESQGSKHLYQHNNANTVRSGQMIGKGQVLGTVGSTGASTGAHLHYEVHVGGVSVDPENYLKKLRGYANGGFVDKPEIAWHGEEGLEAIIPLVPQRRDRGIDLWGQAGEMLGMNAEMLQLLLQSNKRTASYGGNATFAGLSGEAGSGDSSSGTSGTIAPSIDSVVRSLGLSEQPMFAGMAEGDMEALYRRNMDEVRMNRHNAMVTKANTELTALTEQTLKYRNALKEVTNQETRLRNETQKQLTATIKRQTQIEKELSKLQNTSKHTEAQRKKYNQLQQEFDNNTNSIFTMENEIRKLNISMDERKVAIYADYIGQLAEGFQKLKDEIAETRADLEFALERTKLTDENNVGKQLEIQYDILKESMRLEATLMNNMNKTQAEYSRAVSKYGKNSEQALLAREQARSVEEEYQSAIIDRIKLEQSIETTRAEVADEGISNLKDYYQQTQTMTERAIDLERKALEKAHDRKMSMYDDEIAKISSIYDTRLNEMDEDKAEEEYQQGIADLNAQRADLMMQVSRASRDNSLEGKKRLAEFQNELSTVNAEIEKTQRERQDTLYRQSIERQRDEQIQALENEKAREETEQEARLTSLDKQIEDAQAYTERMVGDEAMWKNVKDQFVAGNTNLLATMVEEMTRDMSRFMSGNYNGISMGYGELSGEDKQLFDEQTLLEISNMMLSASDSMDKFSSTANQAVENLGNVSGGNYNAGAMTTWGGTTLQSSAQTTPTITKPKPKPAPKPVADNRHHTVAKGDTLWDLAQKYYGNPYQWTKIAQANSSPDPRKLQIGRRLLVPFDTGGFTGDWTGDAGRLAVLHKKELVLNETQTKDILNVAKVVDGIMGIIPKLQVNKPNLSTSGNGSAGDTYVIDNLNLNMNDFKGSRQDARNAFDNMAKELKKRGKK